MQRVEMIKELVGKELRAAGFDEFELVEANCEKPNGAGYHALTAKMPGSNVCPNINIDVIEQAVAERPDSTVEDIVKDYMSRIIDAIKNPLPFDVEWVKDFSFAKGAFYLGVCNIQGNDEFLSKVPYFTMEDLAFYVRIYVEIPGKNGGVGSIVVRNEYLNTWGITEDELFEAAKFSTQTLMPLEVISMKDLLMGFDMPGVPSGELQPTNLCMFVCSNDKRVNGASVLAYPGFYDEVKDRTGFEEFYVLPSSLHEVLVLPVFAKTPEERLGEVSELREMVMFVNSHEVAPEELLSYNVYYFDSEGNFHTAVKEKCEKTA